MTADPGELFGAWVRERAGGYGWDGDTGFRGRPTAQERSSDGAVPAADPGSGFSGLYPEGACTGLHLQ